MKVRLIKPWKKWRASKVFPIMPASRAKVLISRGIAEEFDGDTNTKPNENVGARRRASQRDRCTIGRHRNGSVSAPTREREYAAIKVQRRKPCLAPGESQGSADRDNRSSNR